jgi:antitoxin component of MazEF toxin-antitoxin module
MYVRAGLEAFVEYLGRRTPEEGQSRLDPYVRSVIMVRTMEKRLTKTGNSFALVFDRELLERTGITAEMLLEVSTDGDVIVVTPKRAGRAEKLAAAMDDADKRYWGVFQRLAK